jgi:hypothetical protein
MPKDSKDLFQQVLGRISDLPGAQAAMEGVAAMRERVDDLQKRVRGLEDLERRVETLERRVAELAKDHEPKQPAEATSSAGSKRSSTAAKGSAAKETSGST